MKQYIELGRDILENGNQRGDRTGTGTRSVFGRQTRFDLQAGFPLLTTKKVFVRGLIEELLWFRDGKTNNNDLTAKGVHIWDEWAASNGELGPIYGKQWRSWPIPGGNKVRILDVEERIKIAREQMGVDGSTLLDAIENSYREALRMKEEHHPRSQTILANATVYAQRRLTDLGVPHVDDRVGSIDQLKELIDGLKNKPFSRRHIITAWNPADLPDESISPQANVGQGRMALAPCHCLFQFYVRDISITQRLKWLKANIKNKTSGQSPLEAITYGGVLESDTSSEPKLAWDVLDGTLHWAANGSWRKQFQSEEDMPHAVLDDIGVPKYYLDCQLYQRSADYCVGVPFNIASYALFTMMVAQVTNMVAGEFVHTFGDLHMYNDHVKTFIEVQLPRELRVLPKMWINPEVKDIMDFTIDDFRLEGYDPHDKIEYKVSV